MAEGMATTGGMFRDPNDPQYKERCISCGAFGPSALCPSHYKKLLEALDYYARGAFQKMIDAHMEIVKAQDAEKEAQAKQAEVARLQGEIEALNKKKEALSNG